MDSKKVVGLTYDLGRDSAPVVVLKGAGPEAQAVLQRAQELGDVPIVKDPQLLKELYRVPIDSPIGRELFPVMAALPAHIIQIDQQRRGTSR